MTEGVKIAFERKVISVPVSRLLPTRTLPPGLHETALSHELNLAA
jgi:hypothetical protein